MKWLQRAGILLILAPVIYLTFKLTFCLLSALFDVLAPVLFILAILFLMILTSTFPSSD